MINLRNIETLEALSLDELDRVVGGRGRGKGVYRNRCWFKWFNYGGTDATVLNASEIVSDAIAGMIGGESGIFNPL